MKNLKFFLLLLALTGMVVTWQSCGKDDEPTPEATCTDGIMNGEETGVDCGGPDCQPCEVGVQGKWQSSGDNVAPLLVALFATDSIYAEFNTDNTYLVEQYDTSGTKLTLEGTYTQKESGVGNIWEITVNQSSPAALTSEGIFEVTDNTMKYEIVQTSPDISAVPPTAAAGSGAPPSWSSGSPC